MFEKHLWKSGILSKDAGHRPAYLNSIGKVQRKLVTESLVRVDPDGCHMRWSLIIRRNIINSEKHFHIQKKFYFYCISLYFKKNFHIQKSFIMFSFIFRKKFQFLDIQRKSNVQMKCRYSQKISKFNS